MNTDWSRVYALGVSLIALIIASLYAFSFAFNAHSSLMLLCGSGGLVLVVPVVIMLISKIVAELSQ